MKVTKAKGLVLAWPVRNWLAESARLFFLESDTRYVESVEAAANHGKQRGEASNTKGHRVTPGKRYRRHTQAATAKTEQRDIFSPEA